jgi:hypothetical protein
VRTGGALLFVAFLTLFVQLGGRQWYRSLVELAPEAARPRIRRIGEGIADSVGGYVAGNLLISVVAGTVATIALLATGVPYAVPLGLLVAADSSARRRDDRDRDRGADAESRRPRLAAMILTNRSRTTRPAARLPPDGKSRRSRSRSTSPSAPRSWGRRRARHPVRGR